MNSKKTRVAVLGAGPMGLAAAYQAVKDGHAVVVFEAADRVGGMAASFDFGGMPIERFYHFHCTTDAALRTILPELGIEHLMKWAHTKMGYYYQGRLWDWGSIPSLMRFPKLSLVEKARYALHALAVSRSDTWHHLDEISAQEWIRRWIGEHAFDVLWSQLFALKFHRYADQISAAWIWSRVRRLARSRDVFMREQSGYLEGGSETLLRALRDEIVKGGGEIRLSTPATRVRIEKNRVAGVETEAGFHRFDAVISTVPLPFAVDILRDLPPDILARYRSVEYMAVVCVIAKLTKRLSDKFWINIHDREFDIPGLVEYTNLRPMGRHIVYAPYYLPSDHPSLRAADSVFVDKMRRHLRLINSSLQAGDILDVRVHRSRYAQPVCRVGFSSVLPPWRLPIKNIFVADTTFYYPEDRGISESIELARNMARSIDPNPRASEASLDASRRAEARQLISQSAVKQSEPQLRLER